MDIEGRIKLIYDTQTFASGFQKREFVITTKEQYPQDVKFELTKDRVDIIDQYQQGNEIKVHFNIRGNEYNGKYYVNLQAWRVESIANANATSAEPRSTSDDVPLPTEAPEENSMEDDLPF